MVGSGGSHCFLPPEIRTQNLDVLSSRFVPKLRTYLPFELYVRFVPAGLAINESPMSEKRQFVQ